MRWICLLFAGISFMSFIGDLGMAKFPAIRVISNVGNSSPTLLTLLLFLSTLVLLGRMLRMEIRGEKEKLHKHIKKLEDHIEKLENDKK